MTMAGAMYPLLWYLDPLRSESFQGCCHRTPRILNPESGDAPGVQGILGSLQVASKVDPMVPENTGP